MIAPVNGQRVPTANPAVMAPMPGMGGMSNGNLPNTMPTSAPTNPTQTSQQNPYSPPTATTTTSTLSGLPPGTVQTAPINWQDGSFTVTGDLKDTLGAGTGTAVSDVLQNYGTINDQAIQAMIANTNLAAGKQIGNIQASEAASGITPDSSTAALASGDFWSTVNSQLQENISGMELSQENTLLNTLLKTGTAHGPDETTFQSIQDALGSFGGLLGGGAQMASAGVSAANPAADTSWLDMLGLLAG